MNGGRSCLLRATLAFSFSLTVQAGNGVAIAQSADLVTDRPDKTESARVVPKGLVQVETGYLFTRDGDVGSYEVPGTLFRIGFGGRTELRVSHVGVVGREGIHGAGDSELGAKINLIERADGWQPEFAVLAGLSLPTGEDGLSSDSIDPSFLLSFAHELSPKLSLGYNVGATWESFAHQQFRDMFVVYSLAVGIGLTDRLSMFLELFGDRQTTSTTGPSLSGDGGLTFLLTEIVQLDVYVGRGLREPSDDVFFGTGLSFRLPR